MGDLAGGRRAELVFLLDMMEDMIVIVIVVVIVIVIVMVAGLRDSSEREHG